jgi:hypothetical protein
VRVGRVGYRDGQVGGLVHGEQTRAGKGRIGYRDGQVGGLVHGEQTRVGKGRVVTRVA